jgi:hypothetical protein
MTDPTTLIALAERCEQAAGPDRELDIAIAAGLGWPDGRYSPPILPFERVRLPRHYTDSLDTAVTLVPEGWRWWIHSSPFARCWLVADDQIIGIAQPEKCATPALALCAAALRARAAANE